MVLKSPFVVRAPVRPEPVETARLWAVFVADRDQATREKLMKAYMSFARVMAAKVYARRIYTEMEYADYLQYATVGLIESIDRFDPTRGILFETYAAARITGSMLNGIERSSEVQQQIAARKQIMAQRIASMAEGAAGMKSADVVFAHLAELAIGLAVGFALEDSGMYCAENAEFADNSYTGIELKQLQGRVLIAVAALPANQRQVIESHYLQRLQFEEVATAMSLTRGRIAQIHKQALGTLRTLLQKPQEIDVSC